MMSGTGWTFSMASTGKGGGKISVTEAGMGVRSLVSQPIFFAARSMVMMLTTIKGNA